MFLRPFILRLSVWLLTASFKKFLVVFPKTFTKCCYSLKEELIESQVILFQRCCHGNHFWSNVQITLSPFLFCIEILKHHGHCQGQTFRFTLSVHLFYLVSLDWHHWKAVYKGHPSKSSWLQWQQFWYNNVIMIFCPFKILDQQEYHLNCIGYLSIRQLQ